MLDAALRQLSRHRAGRKPLARRPDRPADVDESTIVHPDAPAAEAGPGFSLAPSPQGFADPFDPFPFDSPAARLDAQPVAAADSSSFDVPLDRGVADRAAAKTKAKRTDSRLPERQPALVAARAGLMRDRMQENVDELRKTMEKPELATTMGQRVVGEEAARAAKRGDLQGFRTALASLVQKMDVSSPKDAAVLIKQEPGIQASGQVQALLAQGKSTLSSTPGGRLFGQISPILRDYAPPNMKGEVDGAWGGLAERFATGAKGKVDVVLGTASPGAPAGGGGAGVPASFPGPGAAPGGATAPGQLGVFEVGSEVAAAPGAAGPGGASVPPASSIKVGEMDPSEARNVRLGAGPSLSGPSNSGVGEVNPDGLVQGTPGKPAVPFSSTPVSVGESTNTAQRIAPQSGMAPPGAINVSPTEMPADTARRVMPQTGLPQTGMPQSGSSAPQGGLPPPGAINVNVVEMSPATPQHAVVEQAGRSVVAGQLTLKDVLERNPAISEVHLQEVTQTPKGGALKSLGSLARNALLQRLQGGGSSADYQ